MSKLGWQESCNTLYVSKVYLQWPAVRAGHPDIQIGEDSANMGCGNGTGVIRVVLGGRWGGRPGPVAAILGDGRLSKRLLVIEDGEDSSSNSDSSNY